MFLCSWGEVTFATQDEDGITIVAQGADGESKQVRARATPRLWRGGVSVMRRLSGIQHIRMAEFKQPWLVVDTFIDVGDDTPLSVMT
ncbi:MAG: hypothetical protein U0670_23330 [Anaerolineae bacterium]